MHLRLSAAFLAALAGFALPAFAAVNYLDQVTAANATGSYLCSSGAACIDDFEINGVAGSGGGVVPLTGVQAVISSPSGQLPGLIRVNIYTNTGTLDNLRSSPTGDVFSHIFNLENGAGLIQPFPVPGETGNFPGAFLITLPFSLDVSFGQYFLSIQAANSSGAEFFVSGSDNVVEGTLNDLITVINQGPGGQLAVIPDNAAFRVMGVPAPGSASLLVLAGLAATRRRRA